MKAIITGARGQDATLLAGLLRARGYQVLGIDRVRPGAGACPAGIARIDLLDEAALAALIGEFEPTEIYHLAACHHSSERAGSLDLDREMVQTNFQAAELLLQLVARIRPSSRVLLAGSSQMYSARAGVVLAVDEALPHKPATFYGHTKAWSRELLAYYRQRRGVFGSMAILFNHESVLRPAHFLTRKVSLAAAAAAAGRPTELRVLNIHAQVDWSSALDVVEGMRLALAAPEPSDYVLASGVAHRVEDVLQIAFGAVGLNWRDFTIYPPDSNGSAGVLIGNPSKAETQLGWARGSGLAQTLRAMVAADLEAEKQRA